MNKNMVVSQMKNNLGTQTTRIVLTSRDNKDIKQLMQDVSKELMKKNENLYRRLASKLVEEHS